MFPKNIKKIITKIIISELIDGCKYISNILVYKEGSTCKLSDNLLIYFKKQNTA